MRMSSTSFVENSVSVALFMFMIFTFVFISLCLFVFYSSTCSRAANICNMCVCVYRVHAVYSWIVFCSHIYIFHGIQHHHFNANPWCECKDIVMVDSVFIWIRFFSLSVIFILFGLLVCVSLSLCVLLFSFSSLAHLHHSGAIVKLAFWFYIIFKQKNGEKNTRCVRVSLWDAYACTHTLIHQHVYFVCCDLNKHIYLTM